MKQKNKNLLPFSIIAAASSGEAVQNRFTAYLIAAVTNKRIRYMEKQKKLYEIENVQMNVLEKKDSNFERQYQTYKKEQIAFVLQDLERVEELIWYLENDSLLKAIEQLRELERQILLARILGEFTFSELGENFNMKPKQTEMLFYYAIRKLRKKLEMDNNDGI